MKKFVCMLVITLFLASSVSAFTLRYSSDSDLKSFEDEKKVYDTTKKVEPDKTLTDETSKEKPCDTCAETESDDSIVNPFDDSCDNCDYVGGYPVMSALPPKSQAVLDLMATTNTEPTNTGGDLPGSFSWTNFGGDWTTPAKDQANCGSCWAFGALGAMEAALNIASGDPTTDIDLSEQYVLSCLPAAGSCSGGWMSEALLYIQSDSPGSSGNGINGCPKETCMPYQAVDSIPCSSKCSDWDYFTDPIAEDNILFQIDQIGVTSINPNSPSDWELLKSWVYDYGPIVIDIYASSGWSSFFWSNHDPTDVYEGTESSTTNHANLLCGWVDDPNVHNGGYWILKNSWGTGFGYNGFNNVAYGCLRIGDRDVAWVTTPNNWPNAQPPQPSIPIKFVYCDWSYSPGYPHLGEEISFTDQSNGPVVMWEWDFNGDGIIDSYKKNPKHTYYQEGTYKVNLTVTASSGLNSKLEKNVVVKEIWPPIAVSNPSYYGGDENVVHLDGRYSYDVDGSIVAYEWDFDGDGVIDSTASHDEYPYPDRDGEYTATLTVTDDDGATNTVEIEVKIDKSTPPETVALIGAINPDPTVWFDTQNVRVDLVATDWSGLNKLYWKLDDDSWSFVYCYNQREYTKEEITVSGHGIHTIQYYAIDKYGNIEQTKTSQIKIDTLPPNVDVDITNQQGNAYVPPAEVTITATDADSGIDIVKYKLDSIEYTYNGPFTITDGGSHVLEVLAKDIAGNDYTEQMSLVMEYPPNKPAISGPSSGEAGTSYDFDFTATDPFNDDVSYFIDWGDGETTGWTNFVSSGYTITRSHTWDNQGSFNVKAKAKDPNGAESDWGTMSVTMPAPLPDEDPLPQPDDDGTYYTLTVIVQTGDDTGSVSISPYSSDNTYPSGTPVTLTPNPASGFAFDHWSGDVPYSDVEDNPLTIIVDEDKTIYAYFGLNFPMP